MIIYRKAEIDDIPVLIDLRLQFLSEHQGPAVQGMQTELAAAMKAYFEQRFLSAEFIAWLAFDDDTPIAASGLCFFTLPPQAQNPTGRNAYIMNMFTLPKYRRRGIAKTLFSKILEEAKASGCKKISLHASQSGEPLYRQFGFSESKDRELVLKLD